MHAASPAIIVDLKIKQPQTTWTPPTFSPISSIRNKISKACIALHGGRIPTNMVKPVALQAELRQPRFCQKCKDQRPYVKTKVGNRFLYETHDTNYCEAKLNKQYQPYTTPTTNLTPTNLDTGANRQPFP